MCVPVYEEIPVGKGQIWARHRRRAALLLCAWLCGSAAAGGGSPEAPPPQVTLAPFAGQAWPVVPADRCPGAADHAHWDAEYRLGTPLRVSTCWKGWLGGHPFTLTGFSSAGPDAALSLRSRGQTYHFFLGIGRPRAVAFTGNSACFVPSFAKGIIHCFDLRTGGRTDAPPGLLDEVPQRVLGLPQTYPLSE